MEPSGLGILESAFERAVEEGSAAPAEERKRLRLVDDVRASGASNETLRERDRRFRELLEALPAAVYTTDAAGRITYYNQAAAELWGCRPELGSAEWCGSWRLWWPGGTPLAPHPSPMAMALKEGGPIPGHEARPRRPGGGGGAVIPLPPPPRH